MAGDTKSVSKGLEQEMLSYLDDLLRPPADAPVKVIEERPAQAKIASTVPVPTESPEPREPTETVPPVIPDERATEPSTHTERPKEGPVSLARQRLLAREKAKPAGLAEIEPLPLKPLMSKVLLSGPELKMAPEPVPVPVPVPGAAPEPVPAPEPAPAPPVSKPAAAAKKAPVKPPVPARKALPVEPPSPVADAVPAVSAAPVDVPQPAQPEPVAAASPDLKSQNLDTWIDGHPPWASGRFDCLLFSVGGLKLSVPLVLLGGVYPLKVDDLTPIFGMPKWFMGMFKHGDTTIKVVDSAHWIMPEKYPENFREQVRYVIRLHDSEWALACNSIADAFTLQASEVRWRTEHAKRPWLAGTVVQKMCAILDVDQFNVMLENAQPRRK